MEAGDCPTLNMNAMENYLLSQSLICTHKSLILNGLWPFLGGCMSVICKANNFELLKSNTVFSDMKRDADRFINIQ